MSAPPSAPARIARLAVVVAILAGVVWTVGERLRGGDRTEASRLPREGVLRRLHEQRADALPRPAVPLLLEPVSNAVRRDLAVVYDRRAYLGAPPVIPHDLIDVPGQAHACNICHARGGYAARFNAYTPVTPHPQYESCTQCHVPQLTNDLFRASGWASVRPPPVHRPALPGSPPPIPHTLHLRDNCLACHGGPAAPLAVRTPHPERVNCVQCHVPQQTPGVFTRPMLAWADTGGEGN